MNSALVPMFTLLTICRECHSRNFPFYIFGQFKEHKSEFMFLCKCFINNCHSKLLSFTGTARHKCFRHHLIKFQTKHNFRVVLCPIGLTTELVEIWQHFGQNRIFSQMKGTRYQEPERIANEFSCESTVQIINIFSINLRLSLFEQKSNQPSN